MDRKKNGSTFSETVTIFAVVFIIIAVAIAAIVVPEIANWIHAAKNAELSKIRSEFVRNVALATAGFLGIYLAWIRSRALDKQANEAIAQGKRNEQQLRAATETSQGELFHKSVALIGAGDKSDTVAGTALLTSLASDHQGPFSKPSQLVLADFLCNKKIRNSGPTYLVKIARFLNEDARARQDVVNVDGFAVKESDPNFEDYAYLRGVYFKDIRFERTQIPAGHRYTYFRCEFIKCDIHARRFGHKTTMKNCSLKGLDLIRHAQPKVEITGSDLTDTAFAEGATDREYLTVRDCYYLHGKPPMGIDLEQFGDKIASLDKSKYEARRFGKLILT